MKLSVILPTYNQEKYLAHCLESLLDQGLSPSDYEIIIVNDGSKDGTEALANDYAKRYNHIRVLTKPNGGAGAARNAGMDLAKGSWLHFVDPDDYIENSNEKGVAKRKSHNIKSHTIAPCSPW